jgi:hypothetical protein
MKMKEGVMGYDDCLYTYLRSTDYYTPFPSPQLRNY